MSRVYTYPPVFGDPVNGVQPGEQAVHAPAGGPQGRYGGEAHHGLRGVGVGADNEPLRRRQQGRRKHTVQQLCEGLHVERGVTQQA